MFCLWIFPTSCSYALFVLRQFSCEKLSLLFFPQLVFRGNEGVQGSRWESPSVSTDGEHEETRQICRGRQLTCESHDYHVTSQTPLSVWYYLYHTDFRTNYLHVLLWITDTLGNIIHQMHPYSLGVYSVFSRHIHVKDAPLTVGFLNPHAETMHWICQSLLQITILVVEECRKFHTLWC